MAPSATLPELDPPAVPKLTTSSQPPLLVKKLSEKATTPTRGSAFAAGYDIYSAHDTVVPARGKTLVDTDLAIAVPEGTCTKISRLTYN
jgi:dUTP pyrophosphatase